MLEKVAVVCPNIGLVYSGMGPDFRVLVTKVSLSLLPLISTLLVKRERTRLMGCDLGGVTGTQERTSVLEDIRRVPAYTRVDAGDSDDHAGGDAIRVRPFSHFP